VVTGRGTRLAAELARLDVPVAGVRWRPAFDPRALWGLFRAVASRRSEQPLLHAHDAHALTLAAAAAAWFGLPLVATRRVDFPIRRPWLWRRADRVVAISEAVRRVALASGVSAERMVVVPSGITVDRAAPLDLRDRLGLAADAILAVSVGALVAHKDFRTLVAAAGHLHERHPALHWVVAGAGPLHADLTRQIAALGLKHRVHLLGELPDGRGVIQAGDLFVASSREEGLNTSVLDAMALGVPVVSTDAGGLPEALADGAGLLCPREDPVALAEAVAAVVADPALRLRLVTAARAASGRFTSDRMAAGMLSVYHSLARAT
jgi:glycosyltransferase involved in cell wall biosynthesis